MKKLNYAKLNANGNSTVFILDDVNRLNYPMISQKLMSNEFLAAEQVCYIKNINDDSKYRLEMMGGEFCVNAALSFIGYNCFINNSGDMFDFEMSGADGLIAGKANLDTEIELTSSNYKNIPFVKEATHIIFASTIPEKFAILEDLYDLTREDVKIVMRYGNDIKQLFNYPLEDTKAGTWKIIEVLGARSSYNEQKKYIKETMLNYILDVEKK